MSSQWTIEELLAYAAGELDTEESQLLESRVALDSRALGMIAWYRAVAQLIESDDFAPPPPRALKAAAALFNQLADHGEAAKRPPARPLKWLDRLDALVGALLFDSRLQPIAVRRGHAGELIQLAFQAGPPAPSGPGGATGSSAQWEIELRATWSERTDVQGEFTSDQRFGETGTWRVMGQISPESGRAEVAIVLSGSDSAVAEASCDETGMFRFEAPPGVYDLCIRLPECDVRPIILPGIELP
jgi:hypothetical protein